MKAVLVLMLWCGAGLVAGQDSDGALRPEANVNERYTVESAEITGVDRDRVSKSLREDLQKLVGQKFSQEKLDRLEGLIHRAFPGRTVSVNLGRGANPDYIKITFRVGSRTQRFDLEAPQALYSSRQAWSGELEARINVATNSFAFGVLSDGDTLVERFSGIKARYENRRVGSERVHLAFEFDSYHQAWNGATRAAAEGTPDENALYRTRQNFQPVATIRLARGLVAGFGASFQRFEQQVPAAHTEASNAVIGTLRYDRLLEDSGSNKHRLEAGYSLRAATKTLASDYVYARHKLNGKYSLWRGHSKLSDEVQAGVIGGEAPMFERFVLGNSTTLRGWSKFDIAPLGGDRVIHNSLEYRYRAFVVFYDTGAVWTHTQPAVARHSAGAGVHLGDLALLIAFPMRNGRVEPVFIAGLNL
jgi:hypothetical protein